MKGHNYNGLCNKCGKIHQHPKGTFGKRLWKDRIHPSLGKSHKSIPQTENTKKLLSIKAKKRYKDKINHPMFGKHHSEKSKEKNRNSHLGMFVGDKNPFYGKHHTEESKLKRDNTMKERGRYKQLSDKMKLNNPAKTDVVKEKISATLKLKYKEGIIKSSLTDLWKNQEYKKKMIEIMKNGGALKARMVNNVFPNKPEKKLIEIIKRENMSYIYTGQGNIWFKGKTQFFNPDFISKEKKTIIEVFGKYWHTLPGMDLIDKERVDTYSKNGFKTLIIWDYEFDDESMIIQRIKNGKEENKNRFVS